MPRYRSRQLIILITAIIAVVYLIYRVVFTLNLTTTYAAFASILLYLGELYGVINMLLYFVQVWDVYEPPQQPILEGRTVDVFVPTYNEDPDLLRVTLQACVAMDYPHNTYLCDDGGTDARCNDPEKGPGARERQALLKAMCAELGVIYTTRPKNNHAKAGNLNYAFDKTEGEFLIIFDADHVPEPHFITRLIGYFADEKLAFVQTPHAFYNFDSFQARLNHSSRKYWEEGQLFYHVIQPGRNRTGCPIFAGSAAMFRRSALKEVGYIATETITEDMHTGLRMHARGWKSLGISERMVAGQAAQDVTTFHSQRLRWGEGNLSVIFVDNPLTMRGLTWGQRLCYAATILNWASGLFKLAIYLTPLLMLYTGVPPVDKFSWTLGIMMLVYMTMCILGTKIAGNGYGSFWYSELFTMASFWTQVRGTMRALFWRKFQQFVVTAKRGRQSKSIWPFIRPQVYLIVFTALALLWAWSRLALGVSDDPYKPMLATFWAFFHMMLAYLVVRRAFWVEDRRYATRHTIFLPVNWKVDDKAGARRGLGFTSDLNDMGMALIAYQPMAVGESVRLTLHAPGGPLYCDGTIRSVRPLAQGAAPAGAAGGYRHGIQFENRSQALIDSLNLLCLHYAVPRLYRYYNEGHRPVYRKLANWFARRFRSRRFNERRDYRLPLLLFPVGSPEQAAYSVTEDVSRASMAVLLHAQLAEGTEIRYSMMSPLGEISGTGMVLRADRYDLAARPYYRTVIEFDHFDEEGRDTITDLFRPAVHRRLKPLLKPDKAPMPVAINHPLSIGTVTIIILLGVEFGVFRLFYRDDFFLRDVAAVERPLNDEEMKRLDRVYRDTMQMGWPSTDRLVLLGQALSKTDRHAELADVTRRLAPRDPGNADLQVALAHAYDQTEDFERAEADFRRLLGMVDRGELPESRREELLAGLARSVAHFGDADAAAEQYRDLIAKYPSKIAYRHELAGQLLSARRYKEAAQVYDGVNPGREGRVMLVLIHIGAKDLPAAEREARTLLREFPDDTSAQGLLADVLNARGDFRQAKTIYERLLRSGEDELRIGIQLAHASLWAKEYDEALERFEAVLQHSPDLPALSRQYPQVVRAYVNAAAGATRLTDANRKTIVRLYDQALAEPGSDPVYLARLGWVLHRAEEYEKSASLLDQALALNPADQGLRMQLAGVLVAAGRAEEALRLLGDGAATLEARMLLVDVYLAAKNLDAALKECRAIVAEYPNHREARVKLANVLSWKGEYPESLTLFDALCKEFPGDPDLAVRLAEVTLWSGDQAGALKRFSELLAADFERPLLWYGYIDAAAGVKPLDAEQTRLAIAIADRTLAGEHRAAHILEEARKGGRVLKEIPFLTRLGWVLLDRVKDRDRAGAVLNMVRSPAEAAPAERKELAGVFAAAGRNEEALKLYEGLSLDVKDRVNVARIHAALGHFAEAIEQCREALKHQPLDRDARRLLADALSWSGQFRESLREFDALLAAMPNDPELRQRKAEVTLWSGDVPGALALFTDLLKADPNRPALWKGFIEGAGRSEKLTEDQTKLAEQIVARPEALESNDIDFLARCGWILHRHLHDKSRAEAFLTQAVGKRPQDALALTRLAWVLHQAGDKANAATVLDEAIALRPQQPALRRELARVLAAAGRFKDARTTYADLIKDDPADRELEVRLAEVTLWGGDPVAALGILAPLLEADFRRSDLWRSFVDAASAAPQLTAEQLKLARRIAAETPPELPRDDMALFLSRLGWALYRESKRQVDSALSKDSARVLDRLMVAKPEGLKAKSEAAGVLAATGRWKEALPWLEEVAAARPDDIEAQRQLALAALSAGTYEQALMRLQKLLEADFERPALWASFIDAAAGVKKGVMKPDQLALAVRLAAKPPPETAADKAIYLCRLAWVLIREGRADDAAPVIDCAVALDPKAPAARRELAGVLTAAGRFKEARQRLEQLAAATPDDVELQGRVAEAALRSGERTLALEKLTRVLSANFELSQFWNSFVDAAAAVNKGELTPDQVRLAARISEQPIPASVPEPALYLSRLAWALFREGRKDVADPLLDKAAADPPTNPQARRELGGVLTAAGKFREGLKVFEGLELTTDDRLSLVVLHAAAKQFDRAEEQCRLVLKERPNDAKARRWLADVTLWATRYAEALKQYEDLLSADLNQPELWPGFAEAAVNVPALTSSQARLVVDIADRPNVTNSTDAVFIAQLGLLLFRDAEGRDDFPRLAASMVGGIADPGTGTWLAAAALAAGRGQQTRALAMLDRAYQIRPKSPILLARLAWTLFRAGHEARCDLLLAEAIDKKPREPAVRREIGDALVATGRLKLALPWFEALAADQPNDIELKARLAEVTVWAGEFIKGLERLDPLLRADFEQPRLWRPFADAAAGATTLTAPNIEMAQRLASRSPLPAWGRSGRVLFLSRLAWALWREGERTGEGALPADANRLLDAAVALKPDEEEVRKELAGVLTAARRFAAALVLVEELLRDHPNDLKLRTWAARLIYDSGKYVEALQRLEELLSDDFRQPELWRTFADAAGRVKQLTRSQRELLTRVSQQPVEGNNAALFQANIALTLRREAKASADPALLRQADALLAKAQAHPPQSNRARLELAGMLAGAGRTKEALDLARGIPASDDETRAILVDVFAAAGDLDAAEREVRELAKSKPDDWETRFKLASVLGWNHKYAEATELYKQLAAERPSDERIPARLAQVALWGGSYDDALSRFRNLLASGNQSSEILTGFIDAAASAKSVKGESTRKLVLAAFESYQASPPDDPVMLGRLAWVLTRIEDHVRSAELLRKALDLDPTSRELRLRLARALTEAGQFAEADKQYKMLLRTAPPRSQ